MRHQPSGMGTKRGPMPERSPVDPMFCRGCNVEVTAETVEFQRGPTGRVRGAVCLKCDIADPCGLFGPMRPAPEPLP